MLRSSLLFKIYKLLDSRQKRTWILLLFLMVLSSLFEALGIGILFPVLLLLSDSSSDSSRWLREIVATWTGITNPATLVLAVLWGFAFFSVIKSFFVVWVAWCQSKFVADLQMSLSTRLYRGYLREPWSFHLRRNSAELIRNVTSESFQVAVAVQSILAALTELMLVFATTIALLFIEPLGMVICCTILAIAGVGFYYSIRQRLSQWGRQRQVHSKELTKHLQQGLGGAKDIILLNRVEYFVKCFFEHSLASAVIQRKVLLTQALPRHWLEFLGALALTVLVTILLFRGMALSTIVPTIGLFAAAAFRLIPSVNRLMMGSQSLKFMQPSVDTLLTELKDNGARTGSENVELVLKNCIRLDHVTFSYAETVSPAIQDVSLEIVAGQSVGFVGGSGAGKSTLVDVILGLLSPTEGGVYVDGRSITDNIMEWQKLVGYVPQSIFLTDDTLRRNIAFGLPDKEINEENLKQAVASAQLSAFVEGLPDGLDTIVGERGVRLSGGQRQRIGIARALYNNPKVLVFDEATSALDNATELEVMESIKALKGTRTIVIVAHRLTTISHCDRVFHFESGRLIEFGTADQIIQKLQLNTGGVS